ncbi:hypothetical protein JTE90_027562 [Oedothorax gibbosus]|uniref:Uncharacterized protein n=1 Tax=Oedothorax gibbosus TaxID=931172 RepID=A0AAV6VLB6_9ARAC|nr:hypothetical protein JTE90_027562 [Oedothorax gibbosus]
MRSRLFIHTTLPPKVAQRAGNFFVRCPLIVLFPESKGRQRFGQRDYRNRRCVSARPSIYRSLLSWFSGYVWKPRTQDANLVARR